MTGRIGPLRSIRAARPRRAALSLSWGTALALLAAAWFVREAGAQIRPDSLRVPPDSAQVRPDSSRVRTDSAAVSAAQQEAGDSIPADTIFYNLPAMEYGVPPGFATGVWEWDHEAIMASGAHTLAELVAEVPGLVVLLGGDYGTPVALSAFGTGGGGVRILRDGFEVFPLEGGVVDLQRVGLVGLTHVRLERTGGEMVIELGDHRYDDGRPLSLVEAGTGQLDTNAFRGTFAHPTAFAGSLALGLERVDTRGYGENEGGNRTGGWFRYQFHRGDRFGLALDWRSMGSETQVPDYMDSGRRTDLSLRARVEVVDRLVLEAYTGRSTHDVDDAGDTYDYEGGTRAQHGLRLAAARGGLWARGALRLYPDDDFPSRRVDGAMGYQSTLFGASGRVAQADWDGEGVLGYGGTAWLAPLAGLALFASADAGAYAARSGPPLDLVPDSTTAPAPPDPTFSTTERTVLRVGAQVTLAGATLAAAGLFADNDVHLPLQMELDRGSPAVAGTERRGVEAWASLPTPWRSLKLEGSYQYWDEAGPYLPSQIYRGALVFRRTYLESGNFELWWSLGVRGHDAMEVFVPDDGQGGPGGLAPVPFYQSWYGRIQARILTVRLFLGWENFTIRRNLQSYPGRLLPVTRSFFGLHWDLWN